MTQFRGRTEDAEAIFLDAKFWKPGVSISGRVVRQFQSTHGTCFVVELVTPVTLSADVNAKKEHTVSIGNLTGFRMALEAAGLNDGLEIDDAIFLECTSISKTKKDSDQPNFEIEVNRPEKTSAAHS